MKSIEKLYSQYFKDVYRYILSLCSDAHLAEEITQETFFKALKSIDKFKGHCEIKVWLCQIAKNTYFTAIKKQRYIENIKVLENESYDMNFMREENIFIVHQVLHNLKEPYKEVFSLRVFGELSFLQIGKLFDKTENWARVTYYRAKVKIQIALEEGKNETI